MYGKLIEHDYSADVYLYAEIIKPRGRGSKFQWNTTPHYIVVSNGTVKGKFSNKKDAMKAYLLELLRG